MSWSTIASEWAITRLGIAPLGIPSSRISPSQGVYSPEISFATVDFPLPDPPTSATRAPGVSRRLNPWISGG
jgi:hypothetical protein